MTDVFSGEATAETQVQQTAADKDMFNAIRDEHQTQDPIAVNDESQLYAGKYHTVADLVEGYKNSEARYDRKYKGFTGAPEEYTYELTDGVREAGLEHSWDNPAIEDFRKLAQENDMSQEMFEKTLDIMYSSQAEAGDHYSEQSASQEEDSYHEAIMALGGDEQQVEARVEDIVSQMAMLPGVSDDDVIDVVEGLRTPGQIVALEKLLAGARGSNSRLPSHSQSQHVGEDQVRELMSDAMKSNGMDRVRKMEQVQKIMEQRYPGMAQR